MRRKTKIKKNNGSLQKSLKGSMPENGEKEKSS
jgi:hypothetical protein